MQIAIGIRIEERPPSWRLLDCDAALKSDYISMAVKYLGISKAAWRSGFIIERI